MKYLKILTLLLFAMSLNACRNEENKNSDENPSTYKAGTFGYDLDFLYRACQAYVRFTNKIRVAFYIDPRI